MHKPPIIQNSYQPYFIQIRQVIVDRINNGVYPDQALLPSENILSKEFGVTRVTLRKALALLQEEGILTAQKGVGWKVSHKRIEQKFTASYWFGLEVGDTNLGTRSSIVSCQVSSVPASLVQYSDHSEIDEQVTEIVRLRSFKDYPLSLEYSYVPVSVAPGLEEYAFKQESLITMLQDVYGVAVGKSSEFLSSRLSDAEESALLSVPPHSPVFETVRITYTKSRRLLEIRRSIIRGDKVIFRKDFS